MDGSILAKPTEAAIKTFFVRFDSIVEKAFIKIKCYLQLLIKINNYQKPLLNSLKYDYNIIY